MGSLVKLYQKFNEEIAPILYNLFQRMEAEGIHPKSFHEPRFPTVKTRQGHYTKRKLQK